MLNYRARKSSAIHGWGAEKGFYAPTSPRAGLGGEEGQVKKGAKGPLKV